MNSPFVHLHNHTDYSLLDGAASIPNLVAKAKSFGMKHLAITDHGNMFGALRFHDECIKHDINPVVGCEVYIAPESRFARDKNNKYYHMVLLAKNERGYRNLLKIVSVGYKEGFYSRPRIDDETLTANKEDIICTCACIGGEIPQLLIAGDYEKARERAIFYRDLFPPGDYYFELHRHGIPDEKKCDANIIKLAHELNIPIIATNDIHYVEKDHYEAHEIMLCIGTGRKLSDEKRFRFDVNEFYFKSPQEMEALFSDIPEAIINTEKLAQKCSLKINRPGPILPDYPIPLEFANPEDYMRHLVQEGLKKRYPVITEEIQARADYELSIIFDMQGNSFAGYFLIVWDFIHYAKINNIPVGPGRGSGAGSLVAYAMEITDVDPLKYSLLFERFLNPERVSMPDFDVDFCNEGREQVLKYVTEKYGSEKVGAICTFGTLKTKAVIKDVARVLEIPFDQANDISKYVPEGKFNHPETGKKVKWNVKYAVQFTPELKEWYEKGGNYKKLFDIAAILENLNRHVSTHACGIVIGKEELTDYVPLFKDKNGQISTEYTMDLLEPCGLVKMDFLGLKTLTVIKNTQNLIRKTNPEFDIDAVSDEDAKTFALLGEGKSEAIFQFESAGMQKILRDVKPTTLEEMFALNALYRPGPMDFIPQYVDTKKGKQKLEFPDPLLEELLSPTYGVIVYQEQVMQVAQIIAGFTLGRADEMRRAMGKKKEDVLKAMKEEFIAGAEKLGHTAQHADEIFEILIPFAGYGFNKSHAAAYSIIAYKTAYLKAHYPAEFMAANLTNEINSPEKYAQYLISAQQMGIDVLPPNLNQSEMHFSVTNGKIYYGLQGIKKVGETVVDSIIKERNTNGPFQGILDFVSRVDSRVVNKGILEAFISAGLFDEFEYNRATLISEANLNEILKYSAKLKAANDKNQLSLFGESANTEMVSLPIITIIEDWSDKEKREKETEFVGFSFSSHPLDPFKTQINGSVNINLSEIQQSVPKKKYTTIALIRELRIMTVKKEGRNFGKELASGVLEDYNGSARFIIFMDAWAKIKDRIIEAKDTELPLAFIGEVNPDQNGSMENPQFVVNTIQDPSELTISETRTVHIRLMPNLSEHQMFELRDFINENSGDATVYLYIPKDTAPNNEVVVQPRSKSKIKFDDLTMDSLKSMESVRTAWVQE